MKKTTITTSGNFHKKEYEKLNKTEQYVEDITPWQDACKDVIEEATKDNKELYQQIVDMQ